MLSDILYNNFQKCFLEMNIIYQLFMLFSFQFWANYVTCSGQYKDAVRMTVDQMDVIKKYVARYPDTFTFVTTAQGLLLVLFSQYAC